jgi:rod shape determining protein RodA
MRRFFRTFEIRYFDFMLVILVVVLNCIGITTIGLAAPELKSRQIAGMILGLALMVFVSGQDYKKVIQYNWAYYGLCLFVLALVLSPLGSTGGGAQRWIRLGPVTFQPSEAAKILLILFYAKFIMKYRNHMKSLGMVAICTVLLAPPLLLILKQPDLSTSIMIFFTFAVMMFVGGMSLRLAGTILAVTVPAAVIVVNLVVQGVSFIPEYQRNRILSWLHPEDYATSYAYQTMNSIMAIGSGQLMGKEKDVNGFTSLLNSGYIAESQTDFIFTVVGEEFGFIGTCSVVILLVLIAIRCYMIAKDATDLAGAVIASGVGTWVGFQGFLNIAVATGVLPNTGIPLPFVSYGLTSLLSLYMGIGFVLNVRMQNKRPGSKNVHTEFGGANEYSAYRT